MVNFVDEYFLVDVIFRLGCFSLRSLQYLIIDLVIYRGIIFAMASFFVRLGQGSSQLGEI